MPTATAQKRVDLNARIRTRNRISRARDLSVVALAVIGGVYACWSITFGGDTATDMTASHDTTTIGQSALVGSFAERFVVDYLQATQNDSAHLAQYISAGSGDLTLPAVAREASDPTVAFIKQMSPGAVSLWTVTVSVRINEPAQTTPTRDYFRVPVSLMTGGGPRALLLPAEVAAPALGTDVALNYGNNVDSSDQFETLTHDFFTAYLTGDTTQLARLSTANAGFTPATDTYATVSIAKLAADTTDDTATDNRVVHLLVTVSASSHNYTATQLRYPITITAAAGHWQVSAIDSMPLLSTDDASAPTSTAPAAASSATTTAPPATKN